MSAAPDMSNYNALLKWSLSQTPTDVEFEVPRKIDEERKQWLLAAMAEMTCDFPKRMKTNMDALAVDDQTPDALDIKVAALDDLLHIVEDLDNSRDFLKIGGIDATAQALSSMHAEVIMRAADLLATAAQNFPEVQSAIISLNVIPQLQFLLDTAKDEQVKLKALRAVSCLIRGDTPGVVAARKAFWLNHGLGSISSCLKPAYSARVRVKCLYVLAVLSEEDPAAFNDPGMDITCPLILGCLDDPTPDVWEYALRFMVNVKVHDSVLSIESQRHLRTLIENRQRQVEQKSGVDLAHAEELVHSTKLLATLAV